MDSIDQFLKGKKLYGDDFSLCDIKAWYDAEEEGYAGLIKDSKDAGSSYEYDSMNKFYGFNYLPSNKAFENVLGVGSAYGKEFLPIISRIKNLTILEPSENLRSKSLEGLTPYYLKPKVDGSIDFPDAYFDLVTCFGTLHHIPNVNYVLSEIIRVMKPDAFLLLREPIRSMGDWRSPRKGLTKNERGIPHNYFDVFFQRSGVTVIKKSFCESLFAYRLLNRFFRVEYSSRLYPYYDSLISKLFQWNIHYHPSSAIQKVSPGSVFYVVQKAANAILK